jgi:hypothetical protein
VEKSHGKELVEVKIDQDLGQARPLAPHLRIVDDTALAQFLYEGALAVEVVDDTRYVDCVQPAEGFDKAADVASLLPEVGLLPQVGPELLDEIDRPELLEPRRQDDGQTQDGEQNPHIAVDLRANARPPHLDDDWCSIVEAGTVHLCDRGGSQRLVLEVGEYRLDGSAERPLHFAARKRAGK